MIDGVREESSDEVREESRGQTMGGPGWTEILLAVGGDFIWRDSAEEGQALAHQRRRFILAALWRIDCKLGVQVGGSHLAILSPIITGEAEHNLMNF